MQLREEGSILPEGYYPCEYIESDGNQYINTRCGWGRRYKLIMDVEPLSDGDLFGTKTYDSEAEESDAYILGININGYIDCDYNFDNKWYSYNQIGIRSTIEWDKNIVYLNGEKIITLNGRGWGWDIYDAGLFTSLKYSIEDWADSVNEISARMYSCQMYDESGKLLRDYVPCFSAADGKFGLYDSVSKTFFGSETSADFKGKLAVPSGYSAVEYIYGDGNAFIDTGYKHNQTTRVIMDVEPVGTPTENKFLFEGYQADGYRKGIYWNYSNSCWSVDYASSSARKNISTTYAQKLHIDYDRNSCKFNNTTISFTAKTFQSTQNEYILAVNDNGSPKRITPARLYFYCIYDNGTLVRLFAPCVNPSNVYGLYDLVNKKFYQSAGSSQFGEEPTVYDFDYTGGEQSVSLKAGNYKLEVWGAQGGSHSEVSARYAIGGSGGYATGVYKVTKDTNVKIKVGGKGVIGTGGYNGGGNGEGGTSGISAGCGGGGMTSIELSDSADIIICAGGGGGAGGWSASGSSTHHYLYGGNGGAGGGTTGGDGTYGEAGSYGNDGTPGKGCGGTQSSGGLYGFGASYEDFNSEGIDPEDLIYFNAGRGGGGGGGYYGGGGGGGGLTVLLYNYIAGENGTKGSYKNGGIGGRAYYSERADYATNGAGGGGGSSYLSSSLTSASTTAGQRSGHGYARITKI